MLSFRNYVWWLYVQYKWYFILDSQASGFPHYPNFVVRLFQLIWENNNNIKNIT